MIYEYCHCSFWKLNLRQSYIHSLLMHPIPQVSNNELAAGEQVEVTLKGTGFLTMEPFMGFLIQVQPPSNMNPCYSIVTVMVFAGTRC